MLSDIAEEEVAGGIVRLVISPAIVYVIGQQLRTNTHLFHSPDCVCSARFSKITSVANILKFYYSQTSIHWHSMIKILLF